LEVLNRGTEIRQALDAPGRTQTGGSINLSELHVFGLRRSALIEAALFFAVALALDFLLLDGSRFWSWSPHPFWILVILLSCQYGNNEGLIAAGFSSLLLLAGNLPEQSISQDIYDYLFMIARRPLMWSTAAVFLGGLRNRQIEERRQLQAELEASRHREATTAAAFEKLRSIKRKLESRLAGQVRTAATLYKAVNSIEKLQPDEVLRGAVDVMRTLLHPNKFSLFLLEKGRLELSIADGWKPDNTFSKTFSPGHPLFTRIVGERKTLCIAREEDEPLLYGEGVLAGPLIDPGSGEVLGMLKIEELDFVELNITNLETFRVVSEWLATTYKNARKYEYIRSHSMASEKTQLFSYGFFIGHKNFFEELARRMDFQLSMILVRIENEEDLDEEIIHKVTGTLKEMVGRTLRKTDLAFDHGQTGREFAILLPGASVDDATAISKKLSVRIDKGLGELARRVRFSCTTQTLFRGNRRRALLTREGFEARLDFLTRLQSREKIQIVLAAFELKGLDRFRGEDRARTSGIFRRCFERFLRDNRQLAFAYQRSDSQITMVLPSETIESAQQAVDDFQVLYQHEAGSTGVSVSCTLHQISPSEKTSAIYERKNWSEIKKNFSDPGECSTRNDPRRIGLDGIDPR